jgi:hypothetical protein
MTLAGLTPLIRLGLADKRADWPEAVAVFGFFGGAAILTATAFRPARATDLLQFPSEERPVIWQMKMMVVTGAVVCAGLIACLAQLALGTMSWSEVTVQGSFEPVLLLVIIVCSTGFWTLLARSVVGGLLLAAVAQAGLYLLLVLFATTINHMAPVSLNEPNLVHTPDIHSALSWFVGGFGLSYAGIMLWLGRQKFLRRKELALSQQGRCY